MEKVWRPISVWERRPVTSLNGAISSCFRKKSVVFVNKCKTGNSVPFPAAALWYAKLPSTGVKTKILLQTARWAIFSKSGTAFAYHSAKRQFNEFQPAGVPIEDRAPSFRHL
ncbi:hypothetical protein [Marinobacter subterrani]|uniref:hypothetical protein n=1 Tax=Marinobacter subterrani TaxID=1658765 RepID=UPI00235519CD|nr:hypothetical protein [Marinobacter subterrani]